MSCVRHHRGRSVQARSARIVAPFFAAFAAFAFHRCRSVGHAARLLAVVLALAIATAPVHAQGGNGQIEGVVRDEQAAVMPGATVTLRNQESGVTRVATTEADGHYRFPALLPGTYTVQVEIAGFTPQEVRDLTITIGLALSQDFTLKLSAVAESVTVTASPPVVDTTKSEVAGVVTPMQIQTLPINSRQYLSLALLMPGTSLDATRSFFATVNVGGSMTFNSTGNIVDGMINNWDEDGEPRQDLPQDAVQEFKVSNVQAPASFGLATGGIVEVVTRSGTNVVHGDAFEYFRDKSLNALEPFQTTKPDFRRHQFGGAAGGPIVRDRMHFFGALEHTRINEFYTVHTGLPEFYAAVEGTFAQPSHRYLYVGRGDWQISNAQSVFLRYAHEDELSTCGGCGGTTASSAGFDQETPRRSIVLGHTWIRGSNQLNDLRFQYARGGYYIAPGGTQIWTAVGDFSAARINRLSRGYNFPSLSYGSSFDELGPESRWEFRDTYNLTRASHDIKFGGEYNDMPYREENTGNILGSFTFAQDQRFNPNDAASVAALTSAATFSASVPPIHTFRRTQYAVGFVQDDWKLRPNVTVNLGLRYERLYGCCNEDLDPSIFPIAIPYIDVAKRGDRDNFGPRTGLAWDVQSNGSTVVRGGYGRYYGHTRILGALSEFRNYQQFSINISNPAYPDPYGGRDPRSFAVSGPANITVLANDYQQPDSDQFSAGLSQRLRPDLAVHIDGVYTHITHDRKILDINPRDAVTRTRPNQTFGRVDRYQSSGEVKYKALYAKLDKRFSHRTQFLVSYTFAQSDDNAPLVRYLDAFNPGLDFGPSNGERHHAVVASGAVLVPWDVTIGAVWTLRSQLPWNATAGRDLNGDGFNTDLVPGTTRNAGSRDLSLDAVNAWRAVNGLTPIRESDIDSSRINIVDLRASKSLRLSGPLRLELVAQIFNLFNTTNLQAQYGGGRVGNALSASFGRILTARPGTQGELAAKISW